MIKEDKDFVKDNKFHKSVHVCLDRITYIAVNGRDWPTLNGLQAETISGEDTFSILNTLAVIMYRRVWETNAKDAADVTNFCQNQMGPVDLFHIVDRYQSKWYRCS